MATEFFIFPYKFEDLLEDPTDHRFFVSFFSFNFHIIFIQLTGSKIK